jgi:hypothetical protein
MKQQLINCLLHFKFSHAEHSCMCRWSFNANIQKHAIPKDKLQEDALIWAEIIQINEWTERSEISANKRLDSVAARHERARSRKLVIGTRSASLLGQINLLMPSSIQKNHHVLEGWWQIEIAIDPFDSDDSVGRRLPIHPSRIYVHVWIRYRQ